MLSPVFRVKVIKSSVGNSLLLSARLPSADLECGEELRMSVKNFYELAWNEYIKNAEAIIEAEKEEKLRLSVKVDYAELPLCRIPQIPKKYRKRELVAIERCASVWALGECIYKSVCLDAFDVQTGNVVI